MSNDAVGTQIEPDKPVKPAAPTEYMVLRFEQDAGPGMWVELGTAKGVNANQAISKLAGDEPDGTYVAVPARSWRPVTPTVKVERKVSWS